MSVSAEYLIAQYVRNPMRHEPRNLGVIVTLGTECVARFVGEVADSGEIDGRRTKWVANPGVYRKWVKYWREQLRKGGENLAERLEQTNGDNYDVVRGGFVTDYENDNAIMICDNLFELLVLPEDDTSADEPTRKVETEQSARALEAEIAISFRQLGIMSGHTRPSVRHPILRNIPISGTLTNHTPQFVQQNKHLIVMESLSFATAQKNPVKHHAGYMAKMFDDIGQKNRTTERLAIIYASSDELRDKTVRYCLDVLKDSAAVVKWNVPSDRDAFLKERERVACGNGDGFAYNRHG